MPFVLLLIFGFIFLICCANDRAKKDGKARQYYANYTEYRFQEEFLLAYELYMEYRNDSQREDPLKDAEIEAARQMYEQGYMPRHSGGRTYYAKNYDGTQTRVSLNRTYPEYDELQKMRDLDMKNYHGVLHNMGPQNDSVQRQANLQAYNDEIDQRWCKLMEQIAYEEYVLRRKWPLTMTAEYLSACYSEKIDRSNKKKKPTAESLQQLKRLIPKRDYGLLCVHEARKQTFGRPSSFKPLLGQDTADCTKDYTPDVKLDDATFERLITQDRDDWFQLGYQEHWSLYEEYVRTQRELWFTPMDHEQLRARSSTDRWEFYRATEVSKKRCESLAWDFKNYVFSRKPYSTRREFFTVFDADDFTEDLYRTYVSYEAFWHPELFKWNV